MDKLSLNLGLKVKERRTDLNLSQEQLAEKIGKSSGFIGQLERGETSLKISTLKALSDELGLDLNSLFMESETINDESDLIRLNSVYKRLSSDYKELILYIAECFLKYQEKDK